MAKQHFMNDRWHNVRGFLVDRLRTLVVKLEHRWPRVYLALAVLTGALGYVYLWLFPLLLLYAATSLPDAVATAANVEDWLHVVALFALGAFAALMTYSLLRFRPPKPQGLTLDRAQAPRLFKLIDELSSLHLSPKLHRVCLTDSYEIKVMRTPQRGLPLARTNSLMIGLLVMQTLSPAQFKALLAREIGQLSGRHNQLLAWLYHLRGSWTQLARLDAIQPWFCRQVVRAFFIWYLPLYRSVTEIAARRFDETADSYALDIVHHENVTDMLVALAVNTTFVEEKFWPAMHRMQGQTPEPSHLPFSSMMRAFARGVQRHERESWYQRALSPVQQGNATVPSLSDRLRRISDSRVKLPSLPDETAAQWFLGDERGHIEEEMDKRWLAASLPVWRKAYAKRQQGRCRVELLRRRATAGTLRGEEIHEYLGLVERYIHRTEAFVFLEAILTARRTDAKLHLIVGRLLARWHDERGIRVLEQAMTLDERYARRACSLIARYRATGSERPSAVITPLPVESAAVRGAA